MKSIQGAHPPHHHNVVVVTCRLWTVSGRVHVALDWVHDVTIYVLCSLLVHVEHSVCHETISILINIFMLPA